MRSSALVPLLILVVLANGTPMVARKLFGNRCSYPVDGDRAFLDGRPVLGRSKTIRGVALAILTTAAAAPLIGLDWKIGTLVGSLAMAGDLFSSFLKRRLGRSPSSPAVGLDQIPELLFPLLGCLGPLALSFADVAAGVGVFFVGELLFSRLLYAFDLRDRPY